MTPPPKDIGRLLFALYSLTSCKPKARLVAKSFDAAIRIAMDAQEYEIAAAMRDLREQLIDVPHGKLEPQPVADGAYKARCGETRLVSVLTEVVAGWMNDEYKTKYREAITNAVRRMAADFVTLLPDAEGCQGCAGRGAGYCPTCKKSRYGTCGDCGKDLSDEERGQFRCELCSQYPSNRATTGNAGLSDMPHP